MGTHNNNKIYPIMKLFIFTVAAGVATVAGQDYVDYDTYETSYVLDDKEGTGFGIEADTPENGDPDFMPIDGQRQQPKQPQQQHRNYNNNGNNNNSNEQPDNETSQSSAGTVKQTADLCGETGYEESCHANEDVCELEIRERQGYIMQIHMGCKSKDSCQNNKKSNFQNNNPDYTHSVCRQCCETDLCTKDPSWLS